MATQPPVPAPGVQRIIRTALLAGVLIFGAVIFYLRSSGTMTETGSEESNTVLLLVSALYIAGALAGVFVLRGMVDRASDAAVRFRTKLIGWALCEGGALFGGVVYLISGNWVTYMAGVGALVVAILWLPVADD